MATPLFPPFQRRSARSSARKADHQLATGAVRGFSIDSDARISCLAGELWVTGPDTGDQILGPGQTLMVHGTGRVVVEALSPARFAVGL